MFKMEEGDKDSLLWSSDDTKSITTTATDMEENYFSSPMDDSLTTVDELESAINHIKIMVLETDGVSEGRKQLVKRLIDLRMKLQDIKELTDDLETTSEDFRMVNSHHFLIQKQPLHRAPQYCDRCGGIIWTILQYWYRCKTCNYQCHQKCVNDIYRNCPSPKVSNETMYIQAICPEVGLPSQNYRCAECKVHFTLKNSWMEPRRCDYDGLYYCPLCHKNSTFQIPARILHNWDFEERKVSEASKQFLILMARKPNINLEKINPKLFGFVEELNIVMGLRESVIMMKDYFMTCREAISQKILRKLEARQHFVENSKMYSLQDLVDIQNGSLTKFLEKIHSSFLKHIKDECETCHGKGFICEICKNSNVIFPFDLATHQCLSCHAVFHHICFSKRESCPKCLRLSNRASEK